MKKLLDALKTMEQSVEISAVIEQVESIKDLSNYVSGLREDQLSGDRPIISVVQRSEGLPVRLELYWDPKTEKLDLDSNDANPYGLN